jgi:hypothetical protein
MSAPSITVPAVVIVVGPEYGLSEPTPEAAQPVELVVGNPDDGAGLEAVGAGLDALGAGLELLEARDGVTGGVAAARE